MAGRHFPARNLATAFLAGAWTFEELLQRGTAACGDDVAGLPGVVQRLFAAHAAPPPPDQLDTLTDWVRREFVVHSLGPVPLREVFWLPEPMAAGRWPVPTLDSPGALAGWLRLRHDELDWFSGGPGRHVQAPAGPLRHYYFRWVPKRGGRFRLLAAPKARLKEVQRRLLHDILDRVPPHEAAHGFRRGRSVVSYAAPHAGQALVIRFDLKDFFASIARPRVHGLFRALGYPAAVARLLAGLCTTAVPPDVLAAWPRRPGDPPVEGRLAHLRTPHLPQGAPTSPALANLCAYRLDCRLAGLARAVGARYTRYADDLAFSGGEELRRAARRLHVHVAAIALAEGFEVQTRKTRFMRAGVRQQLAGVVVNEHPNVSRDEYERLKATLHNCARLGPASQNRDGVPEFRAHLLGRIAHVTRLNPGRGRKLRAWFERIVWDRE